MQITQPDQVIGKLPVTAQKQPLVSVIIPAYNGLAYIGETLASIRAQTYPNIEIIVVDDGSTDGTVEFLKLQPDVTLFEQPNQGPGIARNAGACLANGAWLAFTDCDDVWVPQKIELQLAAVQEHGVELTYTNARPVGDIDGLPTLQHDPDAMPSGDPFVEMLHDNFMTLSSVLMTRSAFEDLGGFTNADSMRGCEDWNLWLRYLNSCRRVVPVPEPLVLYRWRSDNMTSNHAAMHNARLVALNHALTLDRAQQLSRSEQRLARATLFSCSAWFASRDGNTAAIRLYLHSVLAGGSVWAALKGIARTAKNRLELIR